MRRGLEAFRDDADAWRAAVGARVPVYDRLLEAASALFDAPAGAIEEQARARVEAAWRERRWSAGYDRTLLLMAALRAEALRAGPSHRLFPAIAAPEVDLGPATRAALAEALADAPPRLFVELATRRVQTNETSRAVVWLWPAALLGCAGGRRPLALFDIGCSAGLNLVGDRLDAPWTDTAGAPLDVATTARVVGRRGFDAQPLDVGLREDLNWLRACVWPGENARLARLDRAVAAFRTESANPAATPTLDPADVLDVPGRLEEAAAQAEPATLLLAYQTVVRDYLPEPTKARYVEGMSRWVAGERPGGPRRVWLELESVADAWKTPGGFPMAIDAHLADRADGAGGARMLTLARCSYHPDRLAPDPDAVAAFVAAKSIEKI
jgi:hypothetical protein